ncbi:hypothetical protein Ccrd_006506 [Cynara cardunculus var. scolymus]|uniref:Snf2 ATP coupling domain-containing protein n=1 Tax=Cynara cardunculus var. scolymus TaxID=59895 RepID=A0A103XIL8_CYNCS|nr:hypothetical protein Ccrd_006506 [Cynara cardunculus var. scolymus]
MLNEVAQIGTSSLGTCVPSVRKISHLTGQYDEELWLFEKMDDERRQKGDMPCLIEDHKVPDWVYTKPDNPKDRRGKGYETANSSGSRLRQEVVYVHALREQQWMKVIAVGDQCLKHHPDKPRKEQQQLLENFINRNSVEDDVLEFQMCKRQKNRLLHRFNIKMKGTEMRERKRVVDEGIEKFRETLAAQEKPKRQWRAYWAVVPTLQKLP